VQSSYCTDEFWDFYKKLGKPVRKIAARNYWDWKTGKNPHGFNKHKHRNRYAIEVGDHHRALATKDGRDFIWYWIGTHEEYNRLTK
jgi:hypothetical protein